MTIPTTQKAWSYKEYGPKENLTLGEVPVPPVAPDQVLIKLHAAALNPLDSVRRNGLYSQMGAVDSPLPTVPGFDGAGVVVKVGSKATKFKIGDRVFGDIHEIALNSPKRCGTIAQYTAAEEKLLALIPESLSFANAASLPAVLLSAYQALGLGGLREGQTVLVLGGAGGVGSQAIQLAKHVFKASTVAATTSTPKVDLVKGLGADVVIDYKKESLADHPAKYDLVIDTVGLGETTLAMKEGGKGVAFKMEGRPPVLNLEGISRGSDLEKLIPVLQDGTIKAVIDPNSPFSFADVVEAFGHLESGRAAGKIVISPIE